MGAHETPDHREVDVSCPRTIQFGHEDRLEPSQRHRAITDADRHAMAEQTGAQKGRRIAPLAVRVPPQRSLGPDAILGDAHPGGQIRHLRWRMAGVLR